MSSISCHETNALTLSLSKGAVEMPRERSHFDKLNVSAKGRLA